MKNNYKFKLGDQVMLIGRSGNCVVSGRGRVEFISGGTLNIYQIAGAHYGYIAEYEVINEKDWMASHVRLFDKEGGRG